MHYKTKKFQRNGSKSHRHAKKAMLRWNKEAELEKELDETSTMSDKLQAQLQEKRVIATTH